MSIKYNGKTVAGRYKAQVVTNATSTQKGIIRIATDEEVKSGVNNAVAVTPEQLFAKVDKQEGKSLISDTEIERLANVDNYDDTEIKTIVKEVESTSKNLSTTVEELKTSKQNKLVAGEDVQLITNEDGTVTIDISATEVLTDDITITQDVNKYITAVGLQTKSNGYIYDWVGTSLEYDIGLLNGTITENTRCLITDDKQDIVLTTPELNMPTKVSDLANDSNFTTESKLEEVKSELTNLIDEKVGTGDFVHISGDEFIDGSKTFNSNVNIKGVSSGKLTYVDSVNENNKSYIKINKDGVKFSNDNTAESEKVLLSEDNLIGGDKINIERDGNNFIISSVGTNVLVDDKTIVKNEEDIITTVGIQTKSNTTMYDWIGTREEYDALVDSGSIQSNWVCWIIDDDEVYNDGQESDIVLLDTVLTNQILEGNDKVGKEPQGSLILKSIYPDAYEKIIKYYTTSKTASEVIGDITITYKQCTNGFKILEDKSVYDEILQLNNVVDFFMLDVQNELFYLPVILNSTDKNIYAYYKVSDTVKSNASQIEDIVLNIPYTLFDSKYFEKDPYNLSWLKSEGQYNSSERFVSAYENLGYEYNSEIEVGTVLNNGYTKRGISVKSSIEEYTDYDFVLNEEDKTFRLPLKTLHTDDAVEELGLYFYVGEGIKNTSLIETQGFIKSKANVSLNNLDEVGKARFDEKVSKSGDTMSGTLDIKTNGIGLAYYDQYVDLTTLPATNQYSGILIGDKNGTRIGELECSFQADGARTTAINTMFTKADGTKLYCQIGTGFKADGTPYTWATNPATSDNSTQIATTNFVKSVLSSSGTGLATYKKASSGYIKFNNGIIMQWGITSSLSAKATATVTLPIAFSSTNYKVTASAYYAEVKYATPGINTLTTTTFKLLNITNVSSNCPFHWIAIGY